MQSVRVGLALPQNGSAVFVSTAASESGFTFGLSGGRTFSPLFTLKTKKIALLPDRNASLQIAGGSVSGQASNTGNRGAYSLRVSGTYSSYSAAASRASAYADGFVAYVDGTYEVRHGHYLTAEDANAAKGNDSVAAPVAGGIAVLDASDGKTLLEFESSTLLAIRAADLGAVEIGSERDRPFPGFFEYQADSRLRIVNVIDLETYVKCVMANEIGTNVSKETRRAFSVLVRTVPLTRKHASAGCDVCNSSCCQAYLGNYRRSAENDVIAESTRGEYITYQGSPIFCLYHGSNGGASCSSVAAWGGDEIPYLKSVSLPEGENGAVEVWQYVFTEEELYSFLSSRTAFSGLEGGIENVTVKQTDPYGSGYVTLLSVTDRQNNTVELATSEEVRRVLRFKSANFTVSYSMQALVLREDGTTEQAQAGGYIDADGNYQAFDSFKRLPITESDKQGGADSIQFDGMGSGHGVGFSATGSEQLVSEGYSYRYILEFYFNGTKISKIQS